MSFMDALSSSKSTFSRWVPPAQKRDATPSSGVHDDVFRKVRSILNKLTPEKFDKLVDDLLLIGVDTDVVLKGVVLLIIDKALDEPKYCFLYAQLCQRLAEHAPNFEPDNGHCTLYRILLSKCYDEFENRSRLARMLQQKSEPLSREDAAQLRTAKQKMLGNIRFISELGKLGVVSERALHAYAEDLLPRRRRAGGGGGSADDSQRLADMCADIECLCQLMVSCGARLDTARAMRLMDQYFERMREMSRWSELPARIRFLLESTVELRANGWRVRLCGAQERPRCVTAIRQEARDRGVIMPPNSGSGGSGGLHQPTAAEMQQAELYVKQLSIQLRSGQRVGMDDVFGAGFTLLGTGPGVIALDGRQNGVGGGGVGGGVGSVSSSSSTAAAAAALIGSMTVSGTASGGAGGGGGSSSGGGGGGGGVGGGYVPRESNARGAYNHGKQQQQPSSQHQSSSSSSSSSLFGGSAGHRELPSRFRRVAGGLEERSLRPSTAADGMLFKPQMSSLPSMTGGGGGGGGGVGGGFAGLHRCGAAATDAASSDKLSRAKQPRANTREQQMQRVSDIVDKYLTDVCADGDKNDKATRDSGVGGGGGEGEGGEHADSNDGCNGRSSGTHDDALETAATEWKLVRLAGKHTVHVLHQLLLKCHDKADAREQLIRLLTALRKSDVISLSAITDSLRRLLTSPPPTQQQQQQDTQQQKNNSNDNDNDDGSTQQQQTDADGAIQMLAEHLAVALQLGLMSLHELVSEMEPASHHPLLFVTLAKLQQRIGTEPLIQLFNDSQVSLISQLPIGGRDTQLLAAELAAHQLTPLCPLLSIGELMRRQLAGNACETAFYRWIQANVTSHLHERSEFIHALCATVFRHVIALADQSSADTSTPTDRQQLERAELLRYKQLLQLFTHASHQLQLVAVYALQTVCCERQFARGLLLRWFVLLYDLEIVEEEAFLLWREHISDQYPGKGQALFQVNQWLTWLEQAESDDEDDDAEN